MKSASEERCLVHFLAVHRTIEVCPYQQQSGSFPIDERKSFTFGRPLRWCIRAAEVDQSSTSDLGNVRIFSTTVLGVFFCTCESQVVSVR